MKILKSLKCQNIPYGLFSYSVTVENIHSKLERTVSFGESPLECQVSICGLVLVAQPHLTLQPHGLQSARLLCPWGSPDKNTGVGSHSFSRGSSWPRYRTPVSCIADRAIRKAPYVDLLSIYITVLINLDGPFRGMEWVQFWPSNTRVH